MHQHFFILYLSLMLIPTCGSAVEQLGRQDLTSIVPVVEAFLQSQLGKPSEQSMITVKPPDNRLDLPACSKMEVFLPTTISRLHGGVTVGVRCFDPSPWTIYVQAQIATLKQYLVATVALPQGHVVTENDLRMATGEELSAPAESITDKALAVGRTLSVPVIAGLPITSKLFRKDWVVRQGQDVRLFTTGVGFRISVEVKALANAADGESVQVKTKTGRILTVIARSSGIVELPH